MNIVFLMSWILTQKFCSSLTALILLYVDQLLLSFLKQCYLDMKFLL